MKIRKMCSSRKNSYSPHRMFFVLQTPPPPGNSSLFSYIVTSHVETFLMVSVRMAECTASEQWMVQGSVEF